MGTELRHRFGEFGKQSCTLVILASILSYYWKGGIIRGNLDVN